MISRTTHPNYDRERAEALAVAAEALEYLLANDTDYLPPDAVLRFEWASRVLAAG